MNLPVPVAVGLWVALGIVLLVLVLGGRRRAARRTGRIVPAPPELPADDAELGALRLGPVEATYVATTLRGDWVARVAAHRLGDPAAAQVCVYDGGVVVERRGAPPVFAPTQALRAAALAPGMAGRYVGTDGLVVLTWCAPSDGQVDAVDLDTGLRPRHGADRPRLVHAVRQLLGATPAATDATDGTDGTEGTPTDTPTDPAATPKENS